MGEIHSIVFGYIEWDTMEECISVGTHKYMQQKLQGANTLIWILGMVHTDDDRQEMLEMSPEELYASMIKFRDENRLLVEYPQ